MYTIINRRKWKNYISYNVIPATIMTVIITLLILIFPTSGGTIDLVFGQQIYLHHMAWAQEYKIQIPNFAGPMSSSPMKQNLSKSTLFNFDAI